MGIIYWLQYMCIVNMDRILNEVTNTVHKQKTGTAALETPCGITYHVPEDQLHQTTTHQLPRTTTKCGRCFDDGGGY